MGRRLQRRAVSEEERGAVKPLAHSRTAPARAVERARWSARRGCAQVVRAGGGGGA